MAEEKKKEVKEEVSSSNNSGATFSEIWNKFANTIVGVCKKPMTTITEETKNPNMRDTWIMLCAIVITYALIITAGANLIINELTSTLSFISLGEDIPYFKVFLYAIIIYFVVSFIPILVTFCISKILKNDSFDFKKSMSLYTTSMSVVIPINLIMALLLFLNLFTSIGAILVAVVNIFSFFNYVLGYINLNNVSDDKKSWIITAVIVAWVVVTVIGLSLVSKAITSSATDQIKDTTKYTDTWDW